MSICVCERVIVCVNAGSFISAINICMFTPDNLCSTAVFHRGAVPGWRYTCTHIHTHKHTRTQIPAPTHTKIRSNLLTHSAIVSANSYINHRGCIRGDWAVKLCSLLEHSWKGNTHTHTLEPQIKFAALIFFIHHNRWAAALLNSGWIFFAGTIIISGCTWETNMSAKKEK